VARVHRKPPVSRTGKPLEGANECLGWARRRGLKVRILTNIDSETGEMLQKLLARRNLDVRPGEIYTPADAALTLVRQNSGKRFHFLVSRWLTPVFEPFSVAEPPSDFVVVGDFRDNCSYDNINSAFRHLHEGAELIALQKGRYFIREEGYFIDTGAFVTALEYASGKTARVLGKPEKEFFSACLDEMGLDPADVVVVGDDVTTDIEGAVRIGAAGVLLKTGKYQAGDEARLKVLPPSFKVIESVKELPRVLERRRKAKVSVKPLRIRLQLKHLERKT